MLILLRHGQTDLNAGGRLQGRVDSELTAVGRSQAAAAASAIGQVDRVVSSPLRRARQTASAFADVEVATDNRWVELDYGEFDGRPLTDVAPETWARWRSDLDFALPGGESIAALGRRVREACEELAPDAVSRDIVVVSHVSPIKAAVAWALGVGDESTWRMFLDVAAVCRIAIRPQGPSLVAYNDCSHLRAE